MPTNKEISEQDVTNVLDVLGDADCRRLMRMLHVKGPMSVRTIHDRIGLAESTLYRKMNRMSDTPLVVAETHLVEGGRQPTKYRLDADYVGIDLGGEVTVATGQGDRGRPSVALAGDGDEPTVADGHGDVPTADPQQ